MNEVFQRVNHVERELADVREEMAGFNANLASQGQTLHRIAATLEQRSGTDWKAIWSAASVVLALIALGATLILSPIRQQIESNRSATEALNQRSIVESRAQLQDARDAIRVSEEMGRYKERVDRIDREVEELYRDRRARIQREGQP